MGSDLQKTVRLGSIDAVVVGPPKAKFGVIIFHGYGADCFDLAALSALHPNVKWVFPNGVDTVDLEPGVLGRSWFALPKEALESAMSRTAFDLGQFKFPNLAQLHARLDKMLNELSLDFSQIIVGGFSQGSGVAVDWTLYRKQMPKGLVVLSGGYFNSPYWGNLPSIKGLDFFQSHGTDDPILSYASAQHLDEVLQKGGLNGELMSFRGGHELPNKVVVALQKFIASHLR